MRKTRGRFYRYDGMDQHHFERGVLRGIGYGVLLTIVVFYWLMR